jgi:mannose-6-phosphate isomerase-like protein (cupin superfamily)
MRRCGVFGMTGSYKRVNYTDVETVSGAMRPLTDSLDSEQVGVSIARCEPGWRNKPHDHAVEDHEEIYVLLEGEATVVIDDEPVELEAGDAVWIPPTATRQIQNGDVESALVLVSAPASKCRTTTCVDEPGSWATNGFIG